MEKNCKLCTWRGSNIHDTEGTQFWQNKNNKMKKNHLTLKLQLSQSDNFQKEAYKHDMNKCSTKSSEKCKSRTVVRDWDEGSRLEMISYKIEIAQVCIPSTHVNAMQEGTHL